MEILFFEREDQSRSVYNSPNSDRDIEISSVQRMRHRVRGKSLSCPHFHVLSFLSFGMERADRKRGEIAFARYRFEMTRRTLCSPPFIPFLAKRLLTFPSKKMNESVGIIETEDTRRVERERRGRLGKVRERKRGENIDIDYDFSFSMFESLAR